MSDGTNPAGTPCASGRARFYPLRRWCSVHVTSSREQFMKKRIIAEVLAATCVFAPVAWSQATTPASQNTRYFTTPLEKDPTREVYMVSIAAPPGADNHFHRHPGDQWTAVQEGEITLTIKGQSPIVLKAGDSNYVPRGIIHRQQNLSDNPARYIVMGVFDRGKPVAELVPE
jgi:quercetin dioxygenase-like cupin family protein